VDALISAASGSGFDLGPYGTLGVSGVFVAALFLAGRVVWKYLVDQQAQTLADCAAQRDAMQARHDAQLAAMQARLDKVSDTVGPTLQRILDALQGDRELILRLDAERNAEKNRADRLDAEFGGRRP